MPGPVIIFSGALLIPLAVIISYYDVRYRRIPNAFVIATLIGGIAINSIFSGMHGLLASVGGCALGLIAMLFMHVFGAMGAGDVKLFSAIGSVLGASLVVPTLVVVIITGGLMAILSIIRMGTVRVTLQRVGLILMGLLPGWRMPRYSVPENRVHTIPYGVAITLGSIISLAVFRA
jgi:prepilin peptidase CpaA